MTKTTESPAPKAFVPVTAPAAEPDGHVHGPNCSHGQTAMAPFVRDQPKVGRNDPCPCGSGGKFKKCCGAK